VNFFEHQDRARRQSRRLTLIFILAVVAVVAAIDVILLLAVGIGATEPGAEPLSLSQLVSGNLPLLTGGAATTAGIIGLASLFKVTSLRSGGGQVARQLGGTLVEPDSPDPGRRRLRNVVEEIALASGVPVPEIYLLEQEAGINAFAAGYSSSDAAVAVTRGALEKLSRNELQGVIAHEFSHILNGDMRINIRLMGALFGILLLALIGRRVLVHSRFGRSDRNGGVVVLVAFGLMAVGYVGLFFGRWIKAAVSRQREYLADASAVQFTRDPQGISGALKKIAVYSDASYLRADPEEISHMLFGLGRPMHLFSTHPPLNERISRIDPGFEPEELERLASRILREQAQERMEAERRHATPPPDGAAGGLFNARRLIEQIGSPDWERMLLAAAVAASVPEQVRRAARSIEWAPEVLLYTLLDHRQEVIEQQLLTIARRMGSEAETRVRALLHAAGTPEVGQRLPLLEIAFPALKRHPPQYITRVLATVKELTAADGRIDVYEYLLARVIAQHLWESQNPHRVKTAGRRSLASCRVEAQQVLAVLVRHGNADPAAVAAAFRAGCEALGFAADSKVPDTDDWSSVLDSVLPVLDTLKPAEKERLVQGLATAVMYDGQMVPSELELLRATCDLIHVPLPLLTSS